MNYNPQPDRSGEILALAGTRANDYRMAGMGALTGGIEKALGEVAGIFKARQDADAFDSVMGAAADNGLVDYDTLEKFRNLDWRKKAPMFNMLSQTIFPIAANRQKVNDQTNAWMQYRGQYGGGGSGGSGGGSGEDDGFTF
jgi:hypothetical protein